jgi:hypothetical protein
MEVFDTAAVLVMLDILHDCFGASESCVGDEKRGFNAATHVKLLGQDLVPAEEQHALIVRRTRENVQKRNQIRVKAMLSQVSLRSTRAVIGKKRLASLLAIAGGRV